MDPAIADVERQVALLLRLADRNRRRSRRLEGTLDRSAYLALGLLVPIGLLADERLRLDRHAPGAAHGGVRVRQPQP